MNQVAQRAGVGVGTLYRNYPTREALVLDVYQDEVARIIETAPAHLAELPPREALRQWMTGLVDAMRRKHGLGDALSPSAHLAINEQTYGPVVAAIKIMLDAGKHDETIRVDADPADFLQLTGPSGVPLPARPTVRPTCSPSFSTGSNPTNGPRQSFAWMKLTGDGNAEPGRRRI